MNKLNVALAYAATFAASAVCLNACAEDGYLESEGDARICLVHFVGPNT